MKRGAAIPTLFIPLLILTQALANEQQKPLHNPKCTLYMAESSIPNAGLGVYTSTPLPLGSTVGDPSIIIAVPNNLQTPWSLLLEVIWTGHMSEQALRETPLTPLADVFYPGVGALYNSHLGLRNINFFNVQMATADFRAQQSDHFPEVMVDSAGLHRGTDAGAGAFSRYYNVHAKMSKSVPAGSELFVNYGEGWFSGRESILGLIPDSDDWLSADYIIRKLKKKDSKIGNLFRNGYKSKVERDIKNDVWKLIRDSASDEVHIALPSKLETLDYVSKVGTAQFSLPNYTRSPEWLEEHGMCVDNLYTQTSTIPQAGRGAFAKWFLPKGSIVAPAPVLQLFRDATIDMWELVEDEEEEEDGYSRTGRFVGEQLLLNYGFGNKLSPNLLLLPYSPMVSFINHDGEQPNAEIRWSHSRYHRHDWLSLSLDELENQKFGLMMEFVALRDISPDEEILIDYGNEWQEAWDSHVEDFLPSPDDLDYLSASDLIRQNTEIRTEEEQKRNPYPSNIQMVCYYQHIDYDEDHDGDNAQYFEGEWLIYREWEEHNYSCLRPCKILSKDLMTAQMTGHDVDHYVYTAEMENESPTGTQHCTIPEDERHVITNIPASMITFMDLPHTTDQHLPQAFRHEMMIPDDMIPSSWREE